MGVWGTALYSNDTTCDVRDTYMNLLKYKLYNSKDAYENILEVYNGMIINSDEEPLFWYALADTLWRVGRLLPDVKEKALLWIEKEGGLHL